MYCPIACMKGILIGLKFNFRKNHILNQYGHKKFKIAEKVETSSEKLLLLKNYGTDFNIQ